MHLRQKLSFFALGCAFVVAGQVILAVVSGQAKDGAALPSETMDLLTVNKLRVVDSEGRLRLSLDPSLRRDAIGVPLKKTDPDDEGVLHQIEDVMRVYDTSGAVRLRISMRPEGAELGTYDDEGSLRAYVGSISSGGAIGVFENDAPIVSLIVEEDGGDVWVYDRRGRTLATVGASPWGGLVTATTAKGGAGAKAAMMALENGGYIYVDDRNGNTVAEVP